jgi:hypothetical protein
MTPLAARFARGVRPVVLLALVAGAAAPARVAAQRIEPRFRWPVDATAEVTTTTRSSSVGSSIAGAIPADSGSMRTTMRLVVARDPRGVVVTFDDAKLGEGSGALHTVMAGMASSMGRWTMAQVLDRDGRFVDFADTVAVQRQLDSLRARIRARIGSTPGVAPAVAAEGSAMADRMSGTMLSMAAMRDGGVEFWRRLVGDLTERAWSPGDSATRTVRTPFPVAPGTTLEVPRVTRYEGTVDCPDGAARRCWRFSDEERITEAVMRPAMARFVAEMGMGDLPPGMLPVPEVTMRRILVVDAATLRPLREESTQSITATGEMAAMARTTTTTTEYRWR